MQDYKSEEATDAKEVDYGVRKRFHKLKAEDIHKFLRTCENNPAKCAALESWMASAPPMLRKVIFENGTRLYNIAKVDMNMTGISLAMMEQFVCLSAYLAKVELKSMNEPAEIEALCYKERLVSKNIGIVEDLIMNAQGRWTWESLRREFLRLVHDQLVGRDKLRRDPDRIMSIDYFKKMCRKYGFHKGARTAKELKETKKEDLIDLAAEALQDNPILINADKDVSDPMHRKK